MMNLRQQTDQNLSVFIVEVFADNAFTVK